MPHLTTGIHESRWSGADFTWRRPALSRPRRVRAAIGRRRDRRQDHGLSLPARSGRRTVDDRAGGRSWYWQERSRIALPKEQLVTLDGMFALHPRLAPLKPLWDQHSLAVVHAVGSPSTSRSHFDAQDYMESGTPDVKNTPDGWANRFCTHAAEHANTPFRAVAFGPQLPRTLAGSAPSLAIDDLRTFGMRAAQASGEQKLTRAFEELYEGAGNRTGRVVVRRKLRGDQDAEERQPVGAPAGERRRVRQEQAGHLAAADCAADQGRLGSRDCLRRRRRLGYPRQSGCRPGPAGDASRRARPPPSPPSPPTSARGCAMWWWSR